jgi:hypothetical protein
MAKYLANINVVEETNLPALFYYKHLLTQSKGNPVYYFDEIDKAGIDVAYQALVDIPMRDRHICAYSLEDIEGYIEAVNSTVWHGFKNTTVHENVKDEGLAKKQVQVIAKMIKNHEAPYNDIFKKYSVTIIQG